MAYMRWLAWLWHPTPFQPAEGCPLCVRRGHDGRHYLSVPARRAGYVWSGLDRRADAAALARRVRDDGDDDGSERRRTVRRTLVRSSSPSPSARRRNSAPRNSPPRNSPRGPSPPRDSPQRTSPSSARRRASA